MDYSASIMSFSFWFLETKTTANYILEGLSRKEIVDLSLNENIYQVNSERRARELANVTYKRLKDFPEELLRYFVNADINTAKLFVLISILKTDKLFFEFMNEVFRQNIILGTYTLKKSDFNIFFSNKKNQSEIIDNWKDTTVYKVGGCYKLFLEEAGLLDSSNDENRIILPFIDYRFKNLLNENNLQPYLKAITGEL